MLHPTYRTFTLLLLILLTPLLSTAKLPDIDVEKRNQWVDSIMSTMDTRACIGQLFMVACYPSLGEKHLKEITKYIEKEEIGGILFSVGHPTQVAELANHFQLITEIPLLIAIDGEWGPSMRVDSTLQFPRQMPLGAVTNNQLIYDMGVEVAKQCAALGIHLNFAPVVDINSNSKNPVINTRSFGENKHKVAQKAEAYMQGMQDYGLLTCAKHFPGHGDTDKDSHKELPIVRRTKQQIDEVELYPFKQLIAKGVDGVMVAHLEVPTLEKSPNTPSTLSKAIITDMLRKSLGFNGLIYTDALNMKAIMSSHDPKQLPLQALLAGNDVLLQPKEVSAAIDVIESAIDSGKITRKEILAHCVRVLEAKYNAGLYKDQLNNIEGLIDKLNSPQAQALNNKLAESALTLVVNRDSLLPLKRLDALRIAYLEVGKDKGSVFKERMEQYARISSFSFPEKPTKVLLDKLEKDLSAYNLIIVGYHKANSQPQYSFGTDTQSLAFIEKLKATKKVVLDFFGTPYGIAKFSTPERFAAILVSYNNLPESQDRSAQAIFGGVTISGTLPVTVSKNYPESFGIAQSRQTRLKYAIPEELGIDGSQLKGIDSLVNLAIEQQAMPGCQVLAAHKGVVFYQKAFGRHRYDSLSLKVKLSDLYDMASVTKITATIPLVMRLKDRGTLNLDSTLGKYLPTLPSDKQGLVIRDILTHRSGLQAWIPYYKAFYKIKGGQPLFSDTSSTTYPNQLLNEPLFLNKSAYLDSAYFSRKRSSRYTISVSDSLFATTAVPDYVRKATDEAVLFEKKYRYSDMGLMYMQRAVEAIYKRPLDKLDDSLFYRPLGMNRSAFKPLERFNKNEITPSEQDLIFKKQHVQGTVHDPAAAMLGGVSGHAGLFSNANDMAKLLQLYLNKGEYGGERYFSAATMDEFTRYQFPESGNRRALGFDKPELNTKSNVCPEVSTASYGHSGFTGTFVWVDPERELVYVFLSNRTYPDSNNPKLSRLNVRTEILRMLINAIDGKK